MSKENMAGSIKISTIAAVIGLVFTAEAPMAADWTIIQTTAITTTGPSLQQGNTTAVTGSVQSVNGIQVEAATDSILGGSAQAVTVNGATQLTLTQGPRVSSSTQALNFIRAHDVGVSGASAPTQTVTTASGSRATQLNQLVTGAGSGNSNIQGLNVANIAGDIDALTQSVTEIGTLTMNQGDAAGNDAVGVTTANNFQSGNYAAAVNIGEAGNDAKELSQSISVTGVVALNQPSTNTGGTNAQAMNVARTTTGSINHTTQSATSTTNLTFTQDVATGTANRQAGNLADSATTVADLNQTLTMSGGTLTFDQGATSTDNIQAGNFLEASGNVTNLRQTVTASSTASVSFDQAATANNNTQAGNMATLTPGTGFSISGIAQVFTASNADNDFDQNSAAHHLIQAANLIDVNTGALTDTITSADDDNQQQYTATGTVDLVQTGGGTNNLQALNAVVDRTGGTAASRVRQNASLAGSTFTMVQNNVTNSGQFVNFVGLNY